MNSYLRIGRTILNHSNKTLLPNLAKNSNRAICIIQQVIFLFCFFSIFNSNPKFHLTIVQPGIKENFSNKT